MDMISFIGVSKMSKSKSINKQAKHLRSSHAESLSNLSWPRLPVSSPMIFTVSLARSISIHELPQSLSSSKSIRPSIYTRFQSPLAHHEWPSSSSHGSHLNSSSSRGIEAREHELSGDES